MRNGDQDFVDANLFGILARSPSDIYEGLPAFLVQNLDVEPADPFNEAGPEHFHDRFFCRPSSGKGFVAVLPLLAVFDLFGSVDPVDKSLGVPLDHLRDASDFDDVCSKSDDHRDVRFRSTKK